MLVPTLRRVSAYAAVTLAAALAATAALRPGPQVHAAAAPSQTVTVVASGTGQATPDAATVTLGVSDTESTATAAMSHVATTLQAVLAAVEDKGVAPDRIRTQWVSVQPQYDPKDQTVTGYTAQSDLSVPVNKPEDAGPVIDAALAAGANRVQGIDFTVTDPSQATAQALQNAMAAAQGKAQAIAAAAHETLGSLVSVTQSVPEQGPLPFASATFAAPAAARIPVLPGQQSFTETVVATYALGS
jgi:uncharacterized protein YggE